MTLGKKLSNYRKILGWTQQQLGEHLNLSAQAVSKWENDLAEPDLATLKALASLYAVSIDQLLNTEEDSFSFTQSGAKTDSDKGGETFADAKYDNWKETPRTIGFCKNCGIAVTDENVGKKTPKVLCRNCWELELEEEINDRQRRAMNVKRYEEKRKLISDDLKRRRRRSLVYGGLAGGFFFVIFLPELFKDFSLASLICTFVLPYAVLSFVTLLFYDCPVTNVIISMLGAPIHFPGLIFTFDLGGFLWLIGMKLLFGAIGLIAGLICLCFGLLLGIIIAPFVFPKIMIDLNRDIKRGVESEYVF